MKIVSTMGSGSLGREVELEALASELQEHYGESLETSFHGSSMVTIKLNSGPAYTVYRTGTFQIRGASDEDALDESVTEFREMLDAVGFSIGDFSFRQATSVFTEELGQNIELEVLSLTLGLENTEYEPEQFPALIYRPPEYSVTFLVFSNGKLIIAGTKSRPEAKDALDHLKGELPDGPD